MGLANVTGTARGPNGDTEEVEFLVDSGSRFTLLPMRVWQSIGLEPTREESFVLADGTVISRSMSYCHMIVSGKEGPTPVILGEEGDEALLGVYTLAGFLLVLNPHSRTLHPIRMLRG